MQEYLYLNCKIVKMKFLISLIVMMSIISCSSDDSRENTEIKTPDINGVWKPYQYEYKGKTYPVSTCQQKGQISVNTDFSGVYERYDVAPSSGECNMFDSFAGKWSYDNMSGTLTLTYTEAGVVKTLKKDVDTFSDTELKISDNTRDLDNIPGNDDAVLVFIKQ